MNDQSAMFGTPVSIERQILAIEQMLTVRRRILRKMVDDGGLTGAEMAARMSVLEAVLATLQCVQKGEQP
jgi:hypothetical protein